MTFSWRHSELTLRFYIYANKKSYLRECEWDESRIVNRRNDDEIFPLMHNSQWSASRTSLLLNEQIMFRSSNFHFYVPRCFFVTNPDDFPIKRTCADWTRSFHINFKHISWHKRKVRNASEFVFNYVAIFYIYEWRNVRFYLRHTEVLKQQFDKRSVKVSRLCRQL